MNTPNKISIGRLVLIPIIVLLKIFPYAQFGIAIPSAQIGYVSLSYLNIGVLILFAIGSISDFIDGYIARKYNLITTFGKFIDPIADKALTTTMFILFAVDGIIPSLVVLIMLWRDIIVDGIRMLAAEKGIVLAAGPLGKAKTAIQMITIILILLNNLPFELIGIPMADILLWLSVFLSVASGIKYYFQIKPYIMECK